MSEGPALVLGSGSPYRKELLERLDLRFEVAVPELDERNLDPHFDTEKDADADFALLLARAKASALASQPSFQGQDRWLLTADQIAVLPGPPRTLLHKPGSIDRAVAQLMRLSGKTHMLTTAVVLRHAATAQEEIAIDRHRMT